MVVPYNNDEDVNSNRPDAREPYKNAFNNYIPDNLHRLIV